MSAKVSKDFLKFKSRHEKAIEEARKAENSMQTCAMPVGWRGKCVLVNAIADRGKDKKRPDGSVVEGKPYVRFEFSVVGDKKYAGKKFSRWWFFYDSDNATTEDRFEWFMNDLENMGLPGEIRRSDEYDLPQILDWFLENDLVFECEVVEDDYSRDKKAVMVFPAEEGVDQEEEDEEEDELPFDEGKTVTYLGKEWIVIDQDEEKLKIKSKKTGMVREVRPEDLD